MRIIEHLRRLFPGKWTYSRGENRWNNSEGWWIEPVSQFTPAFDGDDDTFVTRYRRSDTMQFVEIYAGYNDLFDMFQRDKPRFKRHVCARARADKEEAQRDALRSRT